MAPIISVKKTDRGVAARDNRLFMDGVLQRIQTGCPWRDFPGRFGKLNGVSSVFGILRTEAFSNAFSMRCRMTRTAKTCLLTARLRRARRGRAIESETFKTLKSRDVCSFERNFGHGSNHLPDVFGSPAMSAFPVDRVRQGCRGMFRALRHRERNLYLRDGPRSPLRRFAFTDRETLHLTLSGEFTLTLVGNRPWTHRRGARITRPNSASPFAKP